MIGPSAHFGCLIVQLFIAGYVETAFLASNCRMMFPRFSTHVLQLHHIGTAPTYSFQFLIMVTNSLLVLFKQSLYQHTILEDRLEYNWSENVMSPGPYCFIPT